jgi:hypothetical protein
MGVFIRFYAGNVGFLSLYRSNGKTVELFPNIQLHPQKLFVTAGFILLLAALPAAWTQDPVDSVVTPYDSLQDKRIDRVESREQQHELRVNRLESVQEGQGTALDSARLILEEFRVALEHAEREQLLQAEQLRSLDAEVQQARDSARIQRERLARTFWSSSVIILVLLSALFMLLLLHGIRTRHQLELFKQDQALAHENLGRKQRVLGKELKQQQRSSKKAARKSARKEMMKILQRRKSRK